MTESPPGANRGLFALPVARNQQRFYPSDFCVRSCRVDSLVAVWVGRRAVEPYRPDQFAPMLFRTTMVRTRRAARRLTSWADVLRRTVFELQLPHGDAGLNDITAAFEATLLVCVEPFLH